MPNAHRAACLAAVLCSIVAPTAPAQAPDVDYPRNIVYAEVTPVVFLGNISVNYERRVNPWLHARVGVGAGYAYVVIAAIGAAGGNAMLIYTTPNSDHRFEAGLGVSIVTGFVTPENNVLPSLTLGYRREPAGGGFFFRAGAGWTYSYGFPLQLSFGVNF